MGMWSKPVLEGMAVHSPREGKLMSAENREQTEAAVSQALYVLRDQLAEGWPMAGGDEGERWLLDVAFVDARWLTSVVCEFVRSDGKRRGVPRRASRPSGSASADTIINSTPPRGHSRPPAWPAPACQLRRWQPRGRGRSCPLCQGSPCYEW